VSGRRASVGLRRWYRQVRPIAPVILVVIAVSQVLNATWKDLSPWKGGGFGMFATSDSPGTRFVYARGTLLDGSGALIELIFQGVGEKSPLTKSMGRRLQTVPTQAQLDALADRLMGTEFIRTGATTQAAYDRFTRENPDLSVQVDLPTFDDLVIIRPAEQSDAAFGDVERLRLRGVRLEVWRLEFQRDRDGYRTTPLGLSAERSAGDKADDS